VQNVLWWKEIERKKRKKSKEKRRDQKIRKDPKIKLVVENKLILLERSKKNKTTTVCVCVSRGDLQSLSAYFEVPKERPAVRDKRIQSASGLANQEDSVGKWTTNQKESQDSSIDKWFGERQDSSIDKWFGERTLKSRSRAQDDLEGNRSIKSVKRIKIKTT
jgi:hypothetical protein